MDKKTYAVADLPIQILKQGRLFIAYSHALDIATTGKSEKQAVDNFGKLIHIFVEEVKKRGSFEERLTDLGWTHKAKRWAPPVGK